jgi:hypothetical protein
MFKKKDKSTNSNERRYSEHFYDGSTGMNIGLKQSSPRFTHNFAKGAEVVIGMPPPISLTEDVPSFDNSVKHYNR